MLLSANEVARLLGVSKRTVHRLNSSGKIPKPVRIGGSVRWRESDIRQWIAWDCRSRVQFKAMQEGQS
jgi:excisionase family DNA binding protein